jgi:hypothetical protein
VAYNNNNYPGNLAYQDYKPWENPYPQGVAPGGNIVNNNQPQGNSGPVLPKDYVNPNGSVLWANVPLVPAPSQVFTIPGKQLPGKLLLGINGLDNTLSEAVSHAQHLQELSGGHEVTWVYSSCDGLIVDAARAAVRFFVPFWPLSPEAKLLQDNLMQFHSDNANDPNAKCFLSCHSRGAIDVRNALQNLPPEVRNRVIVVALAPAVVVPKALCFQSYNYASKNDPVPQAFGRIVAGQLDLDYELYHDLQEELHRELILLDPHPNDSPTGHEYQNPIFETIMEYHCDGYYENHYEIKPYGVAS